MSKITHFFSNYRNALIAWLTIAVVILFGLHLGIDKSIIATTVVLVGIIGQAFAALLAWIGLIPLVGPMIAHVLALPFIWVINGVGYLVSFLAIKRGYSKDVLNYRIITITLLVGITLGYVLGKVL